MASSTVSTKEFAPREFNRNDQHLTQEGYRQESHAQLQRMTTDAESLTPNDALRLAQRLLVGVDAYGIQQRADFQSPQAVERYVRKAVEQIEQEIMDFYRESLRAGNNVYDAVALTAIKFDMHWATIKMVVGA